VLAACGTPDRPSAFGNVGAVDVVDAGSSSGIAVDGSGQFDPMCNLGPEGGVCACVDQNLVGDVPTIYFVLDRSGSMLVMNKWATVQNTLNELVIALGPRAKIGAAVFPNPAGDSCSTGVQVLAPRLGDRPAGRAGATQAALVNTLAAIPAAGGTPTAATLAALLPLLEANPGRTYVVLATDGGPNCNSFATCDVDSCTSNIDNDTDCPTGGPPNCCTQPDIGPGACLDSQPTIDAVGQLFAAGIPTYVVGVPGSAPYAQLLDQLAVNGGTARGTEPQYYAIDTADNAALLSTLSSIAAKITGTCTLQLDNVPPDPGLVNVFLDETAVPQMGPDGWTIDGTTVTISGASCQEILNGSVLDVRVVAGCPTVIF
jgi:hypothetical protein